MQPPRGRYWSFLFALVAATLAACASTFEYARPGPTLEPRDGKALVFTRLRFFYDRREIFPWDAMAFYDARPGVERAEARHVWLGRLAVTSGSWELHPDRDGTLTLWLSPGDYTLVGSKDDPSSFVTPTLAVVAILRVPADRPVVYAGELTFAEDFRAGGDARYGFGSGSVSTDAMADAVRKLESTYGTLPGPPAVATWCVGWNPASGKPYPDLLRHSRELLDSGCPPSH